MTAEVGELLEAVAGEMADAIEEALPWNGVNARVNSSGTGWVVIEPETLPEAPVTVPAPRGELVGFYAT